MFLSQTPEYARTITRKTLPGGIAGVRATLDEMRRFVRQYKTSDQIRSAAAEITLTLQQKNFMGEIKRLHAYVRDSIRYLRDVNGVEVVQSPPETMRRGYGDCDDKATLLAALLESIGHPTRFVAVGKAPGKFTHVYVETRSGPNWIALETTEPVDAGWRPKNTLARMVAHN